MTHPTTNDLVSLIFTTASIVRKRAAESAAPVSLAQLKALSILSAHESLAMKELAGMLYITPPSATAIVDHLIKDGAITRSTDAGDRRAVRLSITEKGRSLAAAWRAEVSKRVHELLKVLDANEKDALANMLTKIINSQ